MRRLAVFLLSLCLTAPLFAAEAARPERNRRSAT